MLTRSCGSSRTTTIIPRAPQRQTGRDPAGRPGTPPTHRRPSRLADRRHAIVPGGTDGRSEIDLQAVGMDVVRFVVELEWGCTRRAQHDIGLGDDDGEI